MCSPAIVVRYLLSVRRLPWSSLEGQTNGGTFSFASITELDWDFGFYDKICCLFQGFSFPIPFLFKDGGCGPRPSPQVYMQETVLQGMFRCVLINFTWGYKAHTKLGHLKLPVFRCPKISVEVPSFLLHKGPQFCKPYCSSPKCSMIFCPVQSSGLIPCQSCRKYFL